MTRAAEQLVLAAARRRHRPRAFTLVEMLVSLAVLSVALTIIGVVFSVATKTTRQAAAYSEAHNWVRQFMQQLEADLRQCEPSQSVLVLVGRTQAAALTPDLLEAGRFYRVQVGRAAETNKDPELYPTPPAGYSDPRADLLMFFTNRAMASQAPPLDPDPNTDAFGYACRNGARFSPIQVVYGHAALADPKYNPSRGQYDWPTSNEERHIEQTVDESNLPERLSVIPANHWHLSRRATILRAADPTPQVPYTDDVQFSNLACQAIVRGRPYTEFGQDMPGDSAFFNLPFFLRYLGLDFWPVSRVPALRSPYDYPDPPWPDQVHYAINSLLYETGTDPTTQFHHVATVIENPPPELESNLALHMLPGCAWFQVEFLMPEDPRNSLEYAPDPDWGLGYSERYDLPLWTQVEPGQTYVFVPDTQANRELIAAQLPTSGQRIDDFALLVPPGELGSSNTVANRRIRLWPYAIRITVHVFDPDGRLEQPIVRSLVHRFD